MKLTVIDVGLDSGDGLVDHFLGFVKVDFWVIVAIETDKVDSKPKGVDVVFVFGFDVIIKSVIRIDG